MSLKLLKDKLIPGYQVHCSLWTNITGQSYAKNVMFLSEHVLPSNISNMNVINIFFSTVLVCLCMWQGFVPWLLCVWRFTTFLTQKAHQETVAGTLGGVLCAGTEKTFNTNVVHPRKGHKNCLFQSVIFTWVKSPLIWTLLSIFPNIPVNYSING